MICPSCKKVYGDENVFCIECGTRLVDDLFENPMERFSSRVKSSNKSRVERPVRENQYIPSNDNKLDVLIVQNKHLIKQNKRIIELLEKISS